MATGNRQALENQKYGDIQYNRGGLFWDVLHPGTSGQYLKTLGKNKAPTWGTVDGRIVCYDAIVDSTGTYGTHTTIASALAAVTAINNARILIFAGTYAEALAPAGNNNTITLEGCPVSLDLNWSSGSVTSSLGVIIQPATNAFALDLTSSLTTRWIFKGIEFNNSGVGGGTTGTIKADPANNATFDDCYINSGNGSSQTIYLPNAAGTGNGKWNFFRCYGAVGSSSTYFFRYVGSQTAPTLYMEDCNITGGVNVDGNTAGTLIAHNCTVSAVNVHTLTASTCVLRGCSVSASGLNFNGVNITKQVGVANYFLVADCTFIKVSNGSGTAVKLTTGGIGTIEGNRFETGGVPFWDFGVDVGAGVTAVVFGNDYSGCTVAVTGTPAAISSLESAVPVAAHNIFSTTHGDTTGAASPVDGDVIIGNVTPKWSKLAISIPAANVRNALGIDNGELRPSWKTTLDATAPTTIAAGAAAAAGTSLVYSHRDHTHGAPSTYPATAHNILSATHGDALAASVVRGDILVGNSTPAFARVAIGSAGSLLASDGTDGAWQTNVRLAGYLRVGSSAAPSNTTAGDITGVRLHIGADAAFTSTMGFEVVAANQVYSLFGGTITTSTASDQAVAIKPTFNGSAATVQGLKVQPTFSPSASIVDAYAFLGDAIWAPPAGSTITTAVSGFSRSLYSGSVGAVTTGFAHKIGAPVQLTGGTLKPTTQYGLHVENQGLAGITTSVAISMVLPSASTNNYYMEFATNNAAALGAYQGKVPVVVGGVAGFMAWYL